MVGWWLGLALAVEVRLVATASTGGVGSGSIDLDVPEVFDLLAPEVRAVHGVMVLGDELLVADDGRVATLNAFTSKPGPCGEVDRGMTASDRRASVWVPPGSPTFAAPLEGRDVSFRRCAGPGGDVWWAGAGPAPSGRWEDFEHRLTLELQLEGERAWAVGRPAREFARRVAMIEALRTEDALYVDGGDFVDGASSVVLGQLSLHRPLGFAVLRRLAPTALVPGRHELAGGAVRLLTREGAGLPYTAANWRSDDVAIALPDHVRADVQGVDVAVVGVVPPGALPLGLEEGVSLAEAVSAAQQVVDRLRQSPEAPDLVVVATSGDATLIRDLQRRLRGVDVLVGDAGPSVDRVDSVRVELHAPFGVDDTAAVTIPVDGVTLARLGIDDGELREATLRTARITDEFEPEHEVMRSISAVRSSAYPSVDRPLLPPSPAGRWTEEGWTKLVCEALRSETGADLAFLPELPPPPPIPGSLTEKLVLDRLALLDRVEVHEVQGDLLQRLVDKAWKVAPVACGVTPGTSAVVGGRPADVQRVYTLATTDRLLGGPMAAIVQEAHPTRWLDHPVVRRVEDDEGPMTLATAVRNGIRAEAADPESLRALLARTPSDKAPLWLVRLTRLSLSAARFAGIDDDRYEEVPETLATSPSSLTLLADVDTGLEYSDRALAWDLRQRLTYTRLAIGGSSPEVSEPADDLRLSSSLTVPALALRLGSSWSPYGELLYDGELTAVEDDGGTNPIQADSSLTLGLATATGRLTRLRLGGFALRDLSVLDKPLEFGGRVEATALVPLGIGMSWTSTLDGFVFADTPQEDASDLRFKLLIDTRFSLSLARWLTFALYGQVFAFAGRTPATESPAAAWTVGSSLDLAGAFRL